MKNISSSIRNNIKLLMFDSGFQDFYRSMWSNCDELLNYSGV